MLIMLLEFCSCKGFQDRKWCEGSILWQADPAQSCGHMVLSENLTKPMHWSSYSLLTPLSLGYLQYHHFGANLYILLSTSRKILCGANFVVDKSLASAPV